MRPIGYAMGTRCLRPPSPRQRCATRRPAGLPLLAAVILGSLLISSPALAQRTRDNGVGTRAGWLLSLDVEGRWIPALPAFAAQQALVIDGQMLGTGNLPPPGGATMAGVNVGVGCTVNDRWVFPLSGIGVGWAMGPLPRVWTRYGDIPVEMELWSLRSFSLALPGAGFRLKHRRWSFQATIQPTLRVYWMEARAGSESTVDFMASSMTLSVAAQLETCRRFDPINRGCLLLSPMLYEGQVGNGGAIGLRWEFGP